MTKTARHYGFIKHLIFMMLLIANVSLAIEDDSSPLASDCPASDESKEEESKEKTKIEQVAINIRPIFDEANPDENNWIFRLVNTLHIDTHPSVVKNDLLFQEGDKVDEKLIQESERRLRTRSYLSEASIKATNPCDSNANLAVDVHEVWTLLPEISYSHAGGNNSYGFGLHDSNFLGYGKTINITHTSSAERSGNLFEYIDPNTGISNSTFSVLYADNSDGIHKTLEYIRPFASLTTDWSAGVTYKNYSQEDTLFDIGKEVDRFAHDSDGRSIFYGRKLDSGTRESIHRVLLGYTQQQDDFMPVGIPPDASTFVPESRQYNYPWLEYQHIHDDYIKAYNVQQINRVEDINLGTELRVRLGYTSSLYEEYNNAYILDAEYTKGFSLSKHQLILTDVTADGFYRDGEFYSGKVKGVASYHWQNFKRGQFYIELTSARGFRLFPELPLELGGDTGLRGYPARYQAGDHLRLFTVEQRFFGEKEWLSLFYLGAAIFYDEGHAWGESAIPQSEEGRLRDVGIGLRVSGTRTGNSEGGEHNIVHFDIAYPLDAKGDESISKVQWLVRVKKKF